MTRKLSLLTIGLILTVSVAHAETESSNVKAWDMPTGFGVAVREAELSGGITLNAWCMVSTGETGRVSEKLLEYVPSMPAWAPRIMRATVARKGDVLCFGRAGPTNSDTKQLLSFSVAWWENGTQRDSEKHSCRGNRAQCYNRWGSRRGEHRTTSATDALSVCVEVTANRGQGDTLQSFTMSRGEALPQTISDAHGKASQLSCAARQAEWKSAE